MAKKNGYELSRKWFDFSFENTDKVTASHTALYLFLCEINNRLGWSETFQISAGECMAGMSCKSYNTYKKCLDNLIEFGFVKMIRKSMNQYQCNIIGLSNFDNTQYKALAKALTNHLTDHLRITVQSTGDIHKPQTSNLEQQTIPEIEIPVEVESSIPQIPNPEASKKRKVPAKEKEPKPPKPKKEVVVSDSGQKFTAWIIEKIKPVPVRETTIPKIGPMYDKLIRQGYLKDDIKMAVEFAVSDEFWREQFLSPMKLDTSDKQGQKYLDVFIAKAKLKSQPKKQASVSPDLPYVS